MMRYDIEAGKWSTYLVVFFLLCSHPRHKYVEVERTYFVYLGWHKEKPLFMEKECTEIVQAAFSSSSSWDDEYKRESKKATRNHSGVILKPKEHKEISYYFTEKR